MVRTVIYPLCVSIVASRHTNLCKCCLPGKKGYVIYSPDAPPPGVALGAVPGEYITSRRQNIWQEVAKDHNRPRLLRTLVLVERRHVTETRSLYMLPEYFKILAWLWGLGEWNKRNVLFSAEPQDDFFYFISSSVGAKYEFFKIYWNWSIGFITFMSKTTALYVHHCAF